MPGERGNIDMSVIASITNSSDLGKLLSEVIHQERDINNELEEMLQRRNHFQELLATAIAETEEVLEEVQADAEQLLTGVQRAAGTAEDISTTVKALDITQSNVKAALDYIKLLTDRLSTANRSSCVHRLKDSMDRKRYEDAANCIAEFRKLETEISQPPEQSHKEAVEEIEAALVDLIKKNLDSAIESRNSDEVVRLVKLSLLLKRTEEALDSLLQFLKSSIAQEGHKQYQALSRELESASAQSSFTERISDLFRFTAITIDSHIELITESFESEAVLDVLASLYEVCDQYASRILKRFLEDRNVKGLAQEISYQREKPTGQPASVLAGALSLDPRNTEKTLLEILGLVCRCEEFNNLIIGRMKDISSSLNPVRLTRLHESQISAISRELSGFYVAFEEFYIEGSIKKAISIDAPIAGSFVSSVVDDVFFICRKSASRAILSRNVLCVCDILSLMNNLLAHDYCSALQTPLTAGPAAFLKSVLHDPPQEDESKFGLYLNDIQVSLTYISKLKSDLENKIDGVFQISNEKEIVSSLLEDLSATAVGLEKVQKGKVDSICEALMSKLVPAFQQLASLSYNLTETEYEELMDVESWPHQILKSIRHFYDSLESILTAENHQAILETLIQLLASRFEGRILQKSFNHLGGLQIDRDVRLLVTHLSEITQASVRDKFARLTQIATILCFENAEELLEYWGDEGENINWRLSKTEIKSVVRLRTDFSDVSALVL